MSDSISSTKYHKHGKIEISIEIIIAKTKSCTSDIIKGPYYPNCSIQSETRTQVGSATVLKGYGKLGSEL